MVQTQTRIMVKEPRSTVPLGKSNPSFQIPELETRALRAFARRAPPQASALPRASAYVFLTFILPLIWLIFGKL